VQPWELIEEPETTKVGWRTIVKKVFKDPDGERMEAYVKDPIGTRCVAVIALTSENKVVVNEMFRPGPGIVMYELPGGGSSDGDKVLSEGAMRELREETGYVSEDVEYLGKVFKDAWGNAESHYFIARGCVKSFDQTLDREEFILTHEITVDQLFQNARNGLMTDTDGIFLAYEKLMEVKHEKTN
jgi:ADP-ribose pyrophosphatase